MGELMQGIMEIIRSGDIVTVDQAQKVARVLVPIIDDSDGKDAAHAVDALHSVVERMPAELALRAVLDWWLVVAAGAATATGDAYHLPDAIPGSVRSAMESLIEVRTRVSSSPARWVAARRKLQDLLAQLDEKLDLESYGKVALPAERPVWAWFVDTLAPTLDALRSGVATNAPTWDRGQFEREMAQENIQKGSRRWREVLKRAGELIEFIADCVALQSDAEPWVVLPEPEVVDAVPPEFEVELTGLASILLRGVVVTNVIDAHQPYEASILADLADAASETDDQGRCWLAFISRSWLAADHRRVAVLDAVLKRIATVDATVEELRRDRFDADADDIELALLEFQLSEAERLATEALERSHDARRRGQLEAHLLRLGEHLEEKGFAADPHFVDELQRAESAVREGDFAESGRLARELERQLRKADRDQVREQITSIAQELAGLGAASSLESEVRSAIEDLDNDDDALIASERVEHFEEALNQLRARRRSEAVSLLDEVSHVLLRERDTLPAEALVELELMATDARAALLSEDLIAAGDGARRARSEVERRRMRRWDLSLGETQLVSHLLEFCTAQVHFAPEDVKRFFVALKTKPFVILAGLTGSGKSTIVRLFAESVGATTANGGFRRVAVRPDWIDQSEVLGYVNPVSNRFEPGWLAHVAQECQRNPDRMFFVLVDEMNLAPVEQYLAEYLSALEEARSGASDVWLPLYGVGQLPENAADWPDRLPFPANMFLVGTVNVDETTRALSERVLDRANVLQLNVDVSDSHHRPRYRSVQPWTVPFEAWRRLCRSDPDDRHHEFLVDVADTLKEIGIGVGIRAHLELERFVANADEVLEPEVALDLGILQRVIPKIRGFKRDLSPGLETLHDDLVSANCERSARVVASWLAPSVSDDEYLDGTDARVGLRA